MDECQIPIVGLKPHIYGIRHYIFSKMIRSLELLTKATSDVGKVGSPILLFKNLFISAGVKVLPFTLIFDNLSQVKTFPFYAADNVLTLSTIAKMANNIPEDFRYLALLVPIPSENK